MTTESPLTPKQLFDRVCDSIAAPVAGERRDIGLALLRAGRTIFAAGLIEVQWPATGRRKGMRLRHWSGASKSRPCAGPTYCPTGWSLRLRGPLQTPKSPSIGTSI